MLGGLTGNTLPRQYHNLLVEIQRQLTSESKRMSTYGLTEVEDSFDECQLVIEEQSQRNAQAELDRLLQAGPLNPAQQSVFERVHRAYHATGRRHGPGPFIFLNMIGKAG